MALNSNKQYEFSHDSIVIRNYVAGITAGKSLDASAVTEDTILAGTLVRVDADGNYKVGGTAAETDTYAGVTVATVAKDEAVVGIMYDGEVNTAIFKEVNNLTDISAVQKALPSLHFFAD